MALSTSAILPSCTHQLQMKLIDGQRYPVHKFSLLSSFHNHRTTLRCSVKVSAMTLFSEPRKVISHVNNLRDRLWKAFPEPVKEFPWKKAEDVFLKRFLFLGEKALKWSLFIYFISSSLSDVMLSISSNRELIIPFGLFVGCIMVDFLKEVSLQIFSISKERDSRWRLLGISFFFVFVKVASVYFGLGGKVFLSHVGNGGLMQVLWLWKQLQEESTTNYQ